MKLVQKRFLKGSREFEIIDDAVYVRIKGVLKEEKMTVGLSMLKPEPVMNGLELEFHGRAQRETLLSLFVDTPDAETFNDFVETLKQKIYGHGHSPGHRPGEGQSATDDASESPQYTRAEALNWNVYEEPPEFAEDNEAREKAVFKPVNTERVAEDIVMLNTYVTDDEIKPLLDTLEALKAEPDNEAAYQKVVDAFNDLGFHQGAVLTYATYLKVLLSESRVY